jgi:hypothetical protein
MQLLVVASVGRSIGILLRIATSSLIEVQKFSLVFGPHLVIAVLEVGVHVAEEALGVDMVEVRGGATIATEVEVVEAMTSEDPAGSQEIMVGVIKMGGYGL